MSIPLVGPIVGAVASVPLGVMRGIGQMRPGFRAQAAAAAQEQAQFSQTASVMNMAARAGLPPSAEGITAASLQTRQGELLAELEAALGSIFREAGVDPSSRVVLQANALGSLTVANDAARQFTLEAALAANPEVEAAFKQLGAVMALMRAGEAAQAAGTTGFGSYLDAFAPAPGRLLLTLQDGAATAQYA